MTQVIPSKTSSIASSPGKLLSFYREIIALDHFCERFEQVSQHPLLKEFLQSNHPVLAYLSDLSQEQLYTIYSLVILEQSDRVFSSIKWVGNPAKQLHKIATQLWLVEDFYSEIGGLFGVHLLTLESLQGQWEMAAKEGKYLRPTGIDISTESTEVKQAVIWGIIHLPLVAEIYPVGGAADRLSLTDDRTGMALPAAKLIFKGKTLLHGMIEDLQAREYLHFKCFQKQVTTPIAMMTSKEKSNHHQILALCEEQSWFHRSPSSFRFFSQPSIPTMNRKGEWCLQGPMELLMKPGGHGVIWKLARDQGVLRWLKEQNREKALIRQINNPIASTDHGLLAFLGIGCEKDKWFGFASCPRQVKASEGINVLIEKEEGDGRRYVLTNIEYCDFVKFGIQDEPEHPESPYSQFPSNTNILFADLKAVERAVSEIPIPGMLVNFKKGSLYEGEGKWVQEEFGRLESTMQNIADCFAQRSQEPLQGDQLSELKTFLTFNKRSKTISTTKRGMTLGSSLLETPEGCFLDVLANAHDLLQNHCNWSLPDLNPPAHAFVHGPSFICFYHPALGSLYQIIRQKLRGGSLALGSELQLEIADVDMENVYIQGSLIVQAEQIMGHCDRQGVLQYSNATGKCTLKNVTIHNSGMDREAANVYWKNEIVRKQSCHILIRGSGELVAENLQLKGNLSIEVPDKTLVILTQEGSKIKEKRIPLFGPSWKWHYELSPEFSIQLHKNRLHPSC